MAKKPGSKSSRSERRAGRKRAERAHEHGLPVRREPPARAATPEPRRRLEREAGSSSAPLAGAAKPAGIPTLVKVLGGALVILAGVYLLGRQRDEALTETKPSPKAALAPPAAVLEPAPTSEALSASAAASAPAVVASAVAAPPVAAASSNTRPARVVPVTPLPKPVVTPAGRAPNASAAPAPPPAAPKPAENPY
jgi:hypothetical protein